MAQSERDARQLMRQRGAGNRTMPDADFELDFAADTREERLLMRQRGAGNRQIDNIDFGFAFATPSTVRTQRSRTRSATPTAIPQSARLAHHTTPLANSIDPVLLQRSVPHTAKGSRKAPQNVFEGGERDSSLARKRRRLSEVSNLNAATSPYAQRLALAEQALKEDGQERLTPAASQSRDIDLGNASSQLLGGGNIPTSPLFFPGTSPNTSIEVNKENEPTDSPTFSTASKKRKRKSIGQQSMRKRKRSSLNPAPLATPPDTQEEGINVSESNLQNESALPENSDHNTSSNGMELSEAGPALPVNVVDDSAPSLAHQQSELLISTPAPRVEANNKKRKKRKSIVKGKTKRRSSGMTSSTISHDQSQLENNSPSGEELNELSLDLDETILTNTNSELNELSYDHDLQTGIDNDESILPATVPKVPASAISKRFLSEEPESRLLNSEADDDEDESYLPEEHTPGQPKRQKRAKQKRPQQKPQRRQQQSSDVSMTQRRSKRTTFPIVTHRMTNLHALPTILEETDDGNPHSEDQDELSLPVDNFTARSAPNAVDVLSQVVTEVIDAAVQDLKKSHANSSNSNSSFNKQLSALAAFESSLQSRLFTTSQTLDHRLNLEARLRKSRREKVALQNRWLEIRKQRDLLDLKKDAIRRRAWEGEVIGRQKWEVSECARAIEAEVDRQEDTAEGDAVEDEGPQMEVRLREVAQYVSSHNGGGILNAIKAFNEKLERMAGSLS